MEQQVIIRSVKLGETKEDDFTLSLTSHPFDQVKQQLIKIERIISIQNTMTLKIPFNSRLTSYAKNSKATLNLKMVIMLSVYHKVDYFCELFIIFEKLG